MSKVGIKTRWVLSLAALTAPAMAQDDGAVAAGAVEEGPVEEGPVEEGKKARATQDVYEEVLVTGGKEAITTLSGSATFIERDAIERFDVTDVNELLNQVPGVYIRVEDGYGLRPNIGLRGVTSDRSQKITLMEDGILITPAPYSAPAAYYVPNINRMNAMEVFKGPASIQYGPHTVGGAINMATPPIPDGRTGNLSGAYGSDNYRKLRLFYGDDFDNFGYWIDGLRFGSDGFKELDGGGDTGFVRNDFNTKFQWRTDDSAKVYQQFEVKLGYANEDSHETYLGLTDEDFDDDPNRRYVASALDEFESEHYQVHLTHSAQFLSGWTLLTRAYVNEFDRVWFKFDGFLEEDPAFLQSPDLLAIIRGEADADGSDEQTIVLTNNDREYGSRGLDFRASYPLEAGNWLHQLQAGIRYHHDYVDRDHDVVSYQMLGGQLVPDGVARPKNALNRAESDALALFVSDEIDFRRWIFNLGLRYEYIEGSFDDQLQTDRDNENSQGIVIPGLGVVYQWTDSFGLLFGVNKGFSPKAPSAGDDVDPEESINYEYGFRYRGEALYSDVIGFFSDYSNLLGRCRESDTGCDLGQEFNGGEVEIAGVEVTAGYAHEFGNGLQLPIDLVYTYTESAFQTSFTSDFSQWEDVVQGDELPYTPNNRAYLRVGLAAANWGVDFVTNYVGQMRERPGDGPKEEGEFTEALTTFDLAGNYFVLPQLKLQLIGRNLTNEQQIVSRRPFGARPNLPRRAEFGVSYQFF